MNYQTIAAIVVCLIVFVPFAFGAVFKAPSIFDFAIAGACLILLPYTVDCMVVGECHIYAWLIAVAVVMLTVYALYTHSFKENLERQSGG